MSTAQLSDILTRSLTSGALSAADLASMRQAVAADLAIDAREADILFKINDRCITPSGWDDYFIMLITTFLVDQTPPHGYISDINASWLLARINHDGVVKSKTELNLLLNILKFASNVTDNLEAFALNQVVKAVLTGKSEFARSASDVNVITEDDVDMLRKVLYSVSSEGGMGISRLEAKTLFDLNEATSGSANCESWQKLFVCGIANHLMMSAAWEEPDLKEAMRRDAWLADTRKGEITSGFSDLTFRNILSAFRETFGGAATASVPASMDAARLAEAERITAIEAQWLIERLNRDGGIDANETALLKFLSQECPAVHSALLPLIKAA